MHGGVRVSVGWDIDIEERRLMVDRSIPFMAGSDGITSATGDRAGEQLADCCRY